ARRAAPHRARAGESPGWRDDALGAGLRFTLASGRTEIHQPPETMSGGIGLFDYNGDGWLDVYCVQGGAFPPHASASTAGDRLFRTCGAGTFSDAPPSSGIG